MTHSGTRKASKFILEGVIISAAGATLTVMITIGAFSYSRLIFAGELDGYGPLGFVSAMVSAVIIGLFVSLRSSLAGVVAIPQDRIAPIYALIVAQIVSQMPEHQDPSVAAVLALGVIISTTLLTGLILLILGKLRLGNLLRFMPYPVVGGFLAASGYLLLRGGLKLLTGGKDGAPVWDWLREAPGLENWVPGVALALTATVFIRRLRHPLITPLALLLALAAFFVISHSLDISIDTLRGSGLLPEELLPPWQVEIPLSTITHAPWHLVLQQGGLIATILVTTFVSIVLSSSAIELISNQEADLNHELRLTGTANLVTGCFGGMVGFHSLSLSRFSLDMGIPGRKVPILAALLCMIMIPAAPFVLPYVPNMIPGALLMVLGLLLLLEWVVDGYRKLTSMDFSVVLLILFTVALVGYLEGVLVGTVAAVILFIIKYSQVSVITSIATGQQIRSNVERPTWTLNALDKNGDCIHVLRLRGFVFFGTATELLNVIRQRVEDNSRVPVRFMILDFQSVTGFDSSAAVTMTRVKGMALRQGFQLVLCGINERVMADLGAANIDAIDESVGSFPDLDHALEWAENHILHTMGSKGEAFNNHLNDQLMHSWSDKDAVARFIPYLNKFSFKENDVLVQQGDASDSMLFIESGHVTTHVEKENGERLRLRRQSSGTVVGEIGMYLGIPRTASVIAESKGTAYRLTKDTLLRITRDEPLLAAAFHEYVSYNLAARNAFINSTYRTVLD